MIDRDHALSVTKQAEAVGIARSELYYLPRPVSAEDLAQMRQIDELLTEFPLAGSRKLRRLLAAKGSKIGWLHLRTLIDPPPLQWSSLKYGIWHEEDHNAEEET